MGRVKAGYVFMEAAAFNKSFDGRLIRVLMDGGRFCDLWKCR